MVVDEIDRLVLARELVRAGLRTTYVQHLCGLPRKQVSSIWRGLHGDTPMKGKLHESAAAFLESRRDHALYSGYAVFHRHVFGEARDPMTLLSSWREYRTIMGADIDINGCYYVIRDLAMGELALVRCPGCAAMMLDEWGRRAHRCPFCGRRMENG